MTGARAAAARTSARGSSLGAATKAVLRQIAATAAASSISDITRRAIANMQQRVREGTCDCREPVSTTETTVSCHGLLPALCQMTEPTLCRGQTFPCSMHAQLQQNQVPCTSYLLVEAAAQQQLKTTHLLTASPMLLAPLLSKAVLPK